MRHNLKKIFFRKKGHSASLNLAFQNQRGMGLLPVIVAAAGVVLLAYVVGNFVLSQRKVSVKLETSGACAEIGQSLRDYFLKDNNALNVYSFGPDSTGKYPASIQNTDGLPMFRFLPFYDGDAHAPLDGFVTLGSGQVQMPTSVTTYNYLNLLNSFNRLLNLTVSQNTCCTDFTSCNGAEIFNSSNGVNRITGLSIPTNGVGDVRIVLKTMVFEGLTNNICTGGGNVSHMPRAAHSSVKFEADVYITNSQGEKICRAGGTAPSVSSDIGGSLTIAGVNNHTSLCSGSKRGSPSICSTGPQSVEILARTVPDTSKCRDCLDKVEGATCSNNPAGLNAASYCSSDCSPAAGPGSLFMCRIGEGSWFDANPNRWEFCDRARVYDADGSDTGALVEIDYIDQTYPPLTKNFRTAAKIKLSNLKGNRRYRYDVRAVSLNGERVGPSFCHAAPDVCSHKDFGFVYASTAPQFQSPGSLSGVDLDPAGNLSGLFQCQNGPVTYTVNYTYNGMTGSMAALNIESTSNCSCSALAGSCSCSSTQGFSGDGPKPGMAVSVFNDCGGTDSSFSAPWCLDTQENFSAEVGALGNTSAGPNFAGKITLQGGVKACPVAYYCPSITGAITAQTMPCGSVGWSVALNSGCVADPGGWQVCIRVQDGCNRSRNSQNPASYESLLSPSNPSHQCATCPSPVQGNVCESGYCSEVGSSYICRTAAQYPLSGVECNNAGLPSMDPANPCKHFSDCDGNHGTCNSQYQCVATSDPAIFSTQSCIYGSNCMVPDTCNFSGTCNGDSGSKSGLPCSSNWDCSGGVGVGPGTPACENMVGACNRDGSGCSSNLDCDVPGTCDYRGMPGTCQPPTNTSCLGAGSQLFCPTLNSCGNAAPSTPLTCSPACNKTETGRTGCSGACGSTTGTQTISYSYSGCSGPATEVVSCTKSAYVDENGNSCPGWSEDDPTDCVGVCGSAGTQDKKFVCRDSGGNIVGDGQCDGPNPGTLPENQGVACTKPEADYDKDTTKTPAEACADWVQTTSGTCEGACGSSMGSQKVTYQCQQSGSPATGCACGGAGEESCDGSTKIVLEDCSKNPAQDTTKDPAEACGCLWEEAPGAVCKGVCGSASGTKEATYTCGGGEGCAEVNGLCGGVEKPQDEACSKDPSIGEDGTSNSCGQWCYAGSATGYCTPTGPAGASPGGTCVPGEFSRTCSGSYPNNIAREYVCSTGPCPPPSPIQFCLDCSGAGSFLPGQQCVPTSSGCWCSGTNRWLACP